MVDDLADHVGGALRQHVPAQVGLYLEYGAGGAQRQAGAAHFHRIVGIEQAFFRQSLVHVAIEAIVRIAHEAFHLRQIELLCEAAHALGRLVGVRAPVEIDADLGRVAGVGEVHARSCRR